MLNSMNRNGQSNGDFCHHIAQVAGTISYIFLYANLLRVRVHVYESRDLRFFLVPRRASRVKSIREGTIISFGLHDTFHLHSVS